MTSSKEDEQSFDYEEDKEDKREVVSLKTKRSSGRTKAETTRVTRRKKLIKNIGWARTYNRENSYMKSNSFKDTVS